jgi:signal transduction histidine kinase
VRERETNLCVLNRQLEERLRQRTHELRLATEQAERADRVKNIFLATVSHELRTPLNSIIGFSEVLMHGLAGPLTTEQGKQLAIVHASGKHLLSLISEFLDVSRIDAGVLTLRRTRLDLRELIGLDIAAHRAAASARNLQFQYRDESSGTSCQVHGDVKRIRQVLDNLVSNAIKFTDAGTISLVVSDDADNVRLTVTDSGIGIEPDQMSALFAPFARAVKSGERVREGVGLGLAIAKRLVEAMGGTIGAASERGRGSRFWFTLPRSENPPCVS